MKRLIGASVIILVIVVVSMLGSFIFEARARGEAAVDYHEHMVKPGDTLWTIAQKYTNGEGDIRKYIYDIKKANEMENSDLFPGQILCIPFEY
jgi:nucleoid-associated protein YgaU